MSALTEPNPAASPWLSDVYVVLYSPAEQALFVMTLGQLIETESAHILLGETDGDYRWSIYASLDEGEANDVAARGSPFPEIDVTATCLGLSVVVFSAADRTVTVGEFLFEARSPERIVFAHPDPAFARHEAERWRQDIVHDAL